PSCPRQSAPKASMSCTTATSCWPTVLFHSRVPSSTCSPTPPREHASAAPRLRRPPDTTGRKWRCASSRFSNGSLLCHGWNPRTWGGLVSGPRRMRVLVLDGNENQAVAATRSLARRGHEVWVGAETRWSKAGWSRSCSVQFRYPSPEPDPISFVTAIAAAAAAAPGTLVLPMTERTTLPISAHRQRIARARGRLVLPPHDVAERAFDKAETTRLARRLGIAVPRTAVVSSDASPYDTASELRYPVVIKPRSSQEYVGGALRTTGAPRYARDSKELVVAWDELSRRCGSALVQEFVDGAGVGYFALMREGELRAEFAHRRIRDVRPTGSGSSLRVSIAPPPRVREAALAILTALEWHGVAMVEFRMTSDGTPVFMEVNGRFWNSLALPIAAGIDFPALVAALAVDGDVAVA